MAHWSFEDPSRATGTEDERLTVFRRVRDEIAARVDALIGGDDPA
jgi:arsenate reductase